MTFAIARHAAVDLTVLLAQPAAEFDNRLPPNELAELRRELEDAGLRPNRSPEADRELVELRRLYEPYVAGLSNRFMLTIPHWRRGLPVPDNWQAECRNRGRAFLSSPDQQKG